jgi:limonene-1,2-epoxide hydrolase
VNRGSAAGSDTGGLFAAIDAQDGAAFVSYLTEDAVFRFGSAPPVQGRAAVRAAVEGFFDSIAGLSHSIDRTLREGETLVCEGEVTYTRHDGSSIAIPFVDVFEYRDALIAKYKIYIDIAPLYAA